MLEKYWVVLSDEQMSKRWTFSLLNDEQMSNKVRVEHQPDQEIRSLKLDFLTDCIPISRHPGPPPEKMFGPPKSTLLRSSPQDVFGCRGPIGSQCKSTGNMESFLGGPEDREDWVEI